MAAKKTLQFTTPIGVARYPHITRPDVGGEYSDGKYKVELVLEPSEIADLKKQLVAYAKDLGVTNKNYKFPFREKDGVEAVVMKSAYKPLVSDAKRNKIGDDVAVGAGSRIRCIVEAYNYDKGLSLRLKAVQVVELVEAGTYGLLSEFEELEDGFTYVPSANGSATPEGENAFAF